MALQASDPALQINATLGSGLRTYMKSAYEHWCAGKQNAY